MLLGCLYQVESLPAYGNAAQEDQPANARPGVSASEQPLPSRKASSGPDNAEPATDKIKKAEWVAIGINTFIALVVLWQAWIYNQQRKQTRIAERGYVGVDTIDLLDFEIGKIPRIQVVFLNGGRTPLWNCYMPATLEVTDTPPLEDYATLRPPDNELGDFLPSGAKGKVRYHFPKVLDAKAKHELDSGLTKLYLRFCGLLSVFSRIRHVDVIRSREPTNAGVFIAYMVAQVMNTTIRPEFMLCHILNTFLSNRLNRDGRPTMEYFFIQITSLTPIQQHNLLRTNEPRNSQQVQRSYYPIQR